MSTFSHVKRGAAVAACAAVLVGAGAGAAIAQPNAHASAFAHRPAPVSRTVASPFTSASVAYGKQPGTLTVSFATSRHERVAVFAGTSASAQTRLVGTANGSAKLTVTGVHGSWVRLVPASGAPLVLTVRDLGLASDPNLRDAGGYRTADGQWVRMGLVYRSAALTLSAADQKVVDSLGITSDVDLRTPAEIAAAPDSVPTGAKYTNLNIIGTGSAGMATSITTADQMAAMMEDTERSFVTQDNAKQDFGKLITQIANAKGATLYHCSAGKDRTGWTSAVLLTLLGVDRATVTQDYLLSNQYYYDSPAAQATLAAMTPEQAAVYAPALQVRASYLDAGFDEVSKDYGSMYDYAVKGLGISPATIAKLRARMLAG
ncbi:tyrosine-protein phosphatase [Actinacidiphila yeochonensis]|uniref:tyrosine-protein phosphatase n=1 Tax=Actinacidiphila yeochonensis TaxID=89050 RepID=UPI000560A077|nr:tyrosine-protein phosphatase [Actinacidiphila yeochonensis]